MFSEIFDPLFDFQYAHTVSPLSQAAREGDLKKIKKLIANGCLPQNPDNRGWSAIHYCAASNQVESLKLILKLKARNKDHLVNLKTWENVTPLLLALKNPTPSIEMVKFLLKAGASVNQCTFTNFFPLHVACLKKGNMEFVKLLVRHGADVNVQEDFNKFTPLHFAVWEAQDLDIIKYLIKKSNLRIKNVNGRTAFIEACYLNFIEGIKLFIAKDRTLANFYSSVPPIAFAGFGGNLELVQLLIDSGADVNVRCRPSELIVFRNFRNTLLDLDNDFLPIHASVENLDVFKLFLKLTKHEMLLRIKVKCCSFPLFVLMYASDFEAFKIVMQSNLPEELKAITCRDLICFVTNIPEMREETLKKFTIFFKYNFYLEPEDVFQNFACLMSKEEIFQCHKFINVLLLMGVSSCDQFSNKHYVEENLKNFIGHGDEADDNLIESICELLTEPVLTLKQLCRIVVRRAIISKVKSHWLAVQTVEKSILPECLKKFLFFETFT